LNGAAGAEVLAGIQNETVLAHLTGGIAVEEIVGADAVQGKAVAGIALAVGEDGLIAKSGVAARAAQEIGVNAGAENGELREAARAQRRLLNG
jgi:hypothetical protein